jgi:hypothetical protein
MPEGPEIRLAADEVATALVGLKATAVDFAFPKLRPFSQQLRLAIHNAQHSALLYSASDIEVLTKEELETHPFLVRLGPDLLSEHPDAQTIRQRLQLPRFRRRQLAGLLLDLARQIIRLTRRSYSTRGIINPPHLRTGRPELPFLWRDHRSLQPGWPQDVFLPGLSAANLNVSRFKFPLGSGHAFHNWQNGCLDSKAWPRQARVNSP